MVFSINWWSYFFGSASFGVANSATIVDVDNLKMFSIWGGGFYVGQPVSIFSPAILQQSFKTQHRGQFVGLDLYGFFSGPISGSLTVSLFASAGPSLTLLGSVTNTASSLGAGIGVKSFDFSPLDIEISAGQSLAFQISDSATCSGSSCPYFTDVTVNSAGSSTNGYADGFLTIYQSGTYVEGDSDLNFRTLVIPGPVPESTTWALMVGGSGVVGSALRGSRKIAVSFG